MEFEIEKVLLGVFRQAKDKERFRTIPPGVSEVYRVLYTLTETLEKRLLDKALSKKG